MDSNLLMPSLFEGIKRLIDAERFDLLDDRLNVLIPIDMLAIEMIGWLRYSYRVKDRLPSWPVFLAKVKQELELRDLDAVVLLHGLTNV